MKTKLEKVHLHSRRLVPYYIVDMARRNNEDLDNVVMSDTIMTWIEKEQSQHRFQPNDEVCDIDNINLKLRVVQVLKKFEKTIINGKEESRLRIKGIECEYWT